MNFMTPEISSHKSRFLISDDLEEPIDCDYNDIHMDVGVYDEDSDDEDFEFVCGKFKIWTFEIVEKFHGCLSASGYLDQSSIFLGDTQADVAQQLLDAFYDGEEGYMSDDEKQERAWLEQFLTEDERGGMIKQKDFMSFDVKDGAVVLMDNGDMATISGVPAGWGIYVTQPDGTRFLHETAKSKHVITCLIYVYPDTDI